MLFLLVTGMYIRYSMYAHMYVHNYANFNTFYSHLNIFLSC